MTTPVHKGTIKGCVDDYFCITPKTALIRQLLLGPLSLILLLLCLLTNLFILSVLGHKRLRSASNAYLSTAVLSDTLHCVIYLVGVVMPAMSRDEQLQLLVYETIVAYLVPIGEPLGHMLSLLTGLCLISAAVVRIRSHMKHQKQGLDLTDAQFCRVQAIKIRKNPITRRLHLMSAVTIVLLVSAPTFIRYRVVEHELRGKVKVHVYYTALLWQTGWNIYDTVLLMLTILLLVVLIVVLFVITRKWKISYVPDLRRLRSLSRFKKRVSNTNLELEAGNEQIKFDKGELIVKRVKMEIRLVTLLSIMWAIGATGYSLIKLIPTLGAIHLKSATVQEQFLTMRTVMEFMQIFLLFMRTLSYITGGVLVRRVLVNMLFLWLKPKHYPDVQQRGDEVLLDRILPRITTSI
ncbi:hypothetical protein Ciccas_004266 [Cichlidogyrus casuarinus]|uniref:G-protein coupled receptors family 1 profile domain-containing protein n=1 Tax=Cichlidogyrus casuarinus TaxID=1844966 RepID=A0ABD2QBZ4_9PLAT